MTFTLALLFVLLAGIAVLALVAIADWLQANEPVSRGAGPANHRSIAQFGETSYA